jgi:exopolyphosphatase/pppGpp-phosphohydrolase
LELCYIRHFCTDIVNKHAYELDLGNFELGKKIRNRRLDYESIEMSHKRLYNMKPKEIAKISGIGRSRATTITAGSCVINLFMMKLGFKEIIASPSGPRDGILSSFLERPIFVDINNNNSNNKFDSNQIQNPLKYLCTEQET